MAVRQSGGYETMKGGSVVPVLLMTWIAAVVVFTPIVKAQEKKEPPPKEVAVEEKDDTRALAEKKLPKIDLPEFEITGRELIDLPARSKLDESGGYGYLPDPGRLTVLGDKAADSLNALKRKFGASLLRNGGIFSGKINLGYGRFNSPYGEAWVGQRRMEGDFGLHGRYQAHDAYVANSDAAGGEFDAFGGLYLPQRLRVLGGSKVTGQVAYEGEKYRFFGTPNPSLKRTLDNFQVGLVLQSSPNSALSHESSIHFRRLTLRDNDKSREDNLSAAMKVSGDVGGFQLQGDFAYSADFLDQSITWNDPHYLRAAVGFRKIFGSVLDFSASAKYYYYRNSDAALKSKIYPNVALQYYLNRQLTLFAQFDPSVEQNTLLHTVSENRYIGNDVKINHQDVYVNFSGGFQFDVLSRGTGRVYVKYQRVRDFPLYIDPSTVPVPYADWNLRYDGTTRLVSLNGELLLDVSQSDHISGAVTILSTHNTFTADQVPYLAPVTVTGSYAHQFPFGLSTRVTLRFLGERHVGLSDGPRLNSYSLLDASADLALTRNLGIFVRLNNILDEQYSVWYRYQEMPFSVLGGVSVKW
jgi:hypothetical protein